ncbi:MFS family permease [Amycolatopsis bartoniae]|uniref:MFS transporter n=1 Tax=Amycolatopsis bartoniae TaxID=941986 RepID=UPI0011935C46|nr:MFS transporter [Amycolatopsis bartoniae]MBB2935199.1 MFS family permease [Amycolatopsis bartoniae]TVT04089.1 MFS transporter [Amycolatopsis bartoniae]
MSQSVSLADYRAALTTPGSTRPLVASLLARLPIAMIGLSALLYVQRETGSFAAAGLVSAGSLVGVSAGSVVQGRLIDRFGPTRPLLVMVVLFALAMAGLTLAIEAHAATPLLVLLGGGIGITEPMVGSASRALWGRLVAVEGVRNAAFSYEAISMEVFFILGPGLAGLLVAAPWPGTGMIAGSVCMIAGGTLFALSPAVRAWGSAPAGGRRSLLGALAGPGMRTLALAALGFGVVIGFVEVAVPAAATEAGRPELGGVLLSAWSVSSVAFGIAFSLRPWPRAMSLRLPTLLAAFGLLVALLALPSSLWGLALAMLVAGAMITPQSATHSAAIELVAPEGTAAEAFGWVLTAVTLGLAFGQSVSGYLVEHAGPSASFLAASASALVVAAVVWLLRHTVQQPAPSREEALV